MSDHDFVNLSVVYTKNKAACLRKFFFSIFILLSPNLYCWSTFLQSKGDPITFAAFVKNHRDFVLPSTSSCVSHVQPCTSSRFSKVAPHTSSPINMSNLIGAPSCSFSNSLPANLYSSVGFCDKSLRNVRMASTTPTSNCFKLCIFFNYLNIYFPVSVPVSSITVELFLLGGPNCFETKPIDA